MKKTETKTSSKNKETNKTNKRLSKKQINFLETRIDFPWLRKGLERESKRLHCLWKMRRMCA